MGRNREDGKYARGEEWWKLNGNRAALACQCAKCGKPGMKHETPGLYLRMNHRDSHRILCRICPDCLPGLLADLGVEMPK